jgi:hypothetical protein
VQLHVRWQLLLVMRRQLLLLLQVLLLWHLTASCWDVMLLQAEGLRNLSVKLCQGI